MSENRSHRWRNAGLAGVGLAAAAGAIVWLDRRDAGDPWDPEAPRFPSGDERKITTDDGVELALTVAGPADGQAVVLPHCWTGSRAVWGPVAERLVATGNRVVLYDQRGHGESSYGDVAPTIEMLGNDLQAVLAAVDVRDAVLCGHSMGGMTIQSYAAEHPVDLKERVRGIVLVSTAARTLGRALPPRVIEALLGDRYPGWAGRGVLGRAIVRGSIGRSPQRAHVDLTLDGWARTTGYARAGFLSAMASMDLRESLRDAGVPTVVMVGSRDRLTPPSLARNLVAGIPDSDLVVLTGAGHMLPLEAPDEIVDAIGRVSA